MSTGLYSNIHTAKAS